MFKKAMCLLFFVLLASFGAMARAADNSGASRIEAGTITLAFHPEYASPTVDFEGYCYDTTGKKRIACSAYKWDFGDGSGQYVEQNPRHTYFSARSYKVSLTTIENKGNTVQSAIFITVRDSLRQVLMQTHNEFDLSIKGEGFFRILMPSGDVGYTRNGRFFIDKDGNFVTPEGYYFDPLTKLPLDSLGIFVNESGIISVSLPHMRQLQEAGSITISRFPNPKGLKSIGGGFFAETAESGAPINGRPASPEFGSAIQFYKEVFVSF
jgi:flagellar basal body rod protein FlgG